MALRPRLDYWSLDYNEHSDVPTPSGYLKPKAPAMGRYSQVHH
jgi:hypothetical protein